LQEPWKTSVGRMRGRDPNIWKAFSGARSRLGERILVLSREIVLSICANDEEELACNRRNLGKNSPATSRAISARQVAVCHRDVIAITSPRRDFALSVPWRGPASPLGVYPGRKNGNRVLARPLNAGGADEDPDGSRPFPA